MKAMFCKAQANTPQISPRAPSGELAVALCILLITVYPSFATFHWTDD